MTSVGITVMTPVGPGTIVGADGTPSKIFLEMKSSEEGTATTNPLSAVESNVSKVVLKTVTPETDREPV
jgi:hypothetical protein